MIVSTIWNKSIQVNFSKANQIAQAHSAGAICSPGKLMSADLSQMAQRKSCDLLVISST